MRNELIDSYFKTKDITYLHQWVSENIKVFHDMVHKTLRRNNIYNVSKEDLFSEAVIIFYETVDKFDPALGEFSTFIYRSVGNGLINKITRGNNKDYANRVGAVSLDRYFEASDGSTMSYDEMVTKFDEEKLMMTILAHELDEFVSKNFSQKKQDIYHLYKEGLTIPSIALNMGVTKQYVSKVLKDLVEQVREEWQVE